MPLDGDELTIDTPRAFRPFLDEGLRYLAPFGGRASAKSHFFGELAIERCILQPGTRIVCIREHQSSLKNSVKPLLEGKIRKFNASPWFSVLNAEIRAPGNGLIIFQGMKNHTAESIKSLEDFDIAWVEEAQTFSAKSWELLRPTIRKARSQIWSSWNPRYPTDPVDAFFRGKNVPRNAMVKRVSYRDNPYLSDVTKAEIAYDRRRDPDRFKHVWDGDYDTKSEARVFTRWRISEEGEIENAIRKLVPRYGLDFGFARDPMAGLEIFVDAEARIIYISREAYRVGVEIDHIPTFLEQQIPGMKEWTITGDSARPELISHLKRKGYVRIKSARKGPNSVKEGVEFIKGYDIVVAPECVHTIDELTYYAYKIDPMTAEVLPVLIDDKNHIIDALRYALEDVRAPQRRLF